MLVDVVTGDGYKEIAVGGNDTEVVVDVVVDGIVKSAVEAQASGTAAVISVAYEGDILDGDALEVDADGLPTDDLSAG